MFETTWVFHLLVLCFVGIQNLSCDDAPTVSPVRRSYAQNLGPPSSGYNFIQHLKRRLNYNFSLTVGNRSPYIESITPPSYRSYLRPAVNGFPPNENSPRPLVPPSNAYDLIGSLERKLNCNPSPPYSYSRLLTRYPLNESHLPVHTYLQSGDYPSEPESTTSNVFEDPSNPVVTADPLDGSLQHHAPLQNTSFNSIETRIDLELSPSSPVFSNKPFELAATPNSGQCSVPPPRFNGKWTFVNKPSNFSFDMPVPEYSVLTLSCDYDYILDGCSTVVCLQGEWSPPIGSCAKTCPSIRSTKTLKVTCIYKDQETEDCIEAREGTLANFKCKSFYEDNRLSKPKAICTNGNWSEEVPSCTPICGRASIQEQPTLIVRGNKAKQGEFPWQIALYTVLDKALICGGSLISERLVVTAAHCITDNDGTVHSTEKYVVAAGKYYRKFDHPGDAKYTQILPIESMFVSEEYRDQELEFAGDIGIIVTLFNVIFTTKVRPVCIDWQRAYEHEVIDSNNETGYVSGWGYTREYSNQADELKSLRMPSLARKECRQRLPEDYRRYMTFDKFCAGYRNNGTSVCNGDSGGGLVFKRDGRFYLAGIVSISPRADTEEGGCDSQQYGLYTLVYNYTDTFILRKLAEFKARVDTCTSCETASPKDLYVIVEISKRGFSCKFPIGPFNYSVLQETDSSITLKMSCSKNYKYNGTEIITCSKKGFSAPIGTCLELCPPLKNSTKAKVSCFYKGNILENCAEPLDNTVAKFQCAPFYEFATLNPKPSVCVSGKWNYLPKCVPVCGQAPTTLQGTYPWNAAIYRELDKQLVCEGSLISNKIIITAAHCVPRNIGSRIFQVDYVVAVGKRHKHFHHLKDTDAQYSEIHKILIPKTYKSENYQDDIALIITKDSFNLSSSVQPVCIDWETKKAFGWGLTKLSEAPRQRNVTVLSGEDCEKVIDEEFGDYLTRDKFCAVSKANFSQCGSRGLVTIKNNKHYLVGVSTSLPVSPKSETCDTLPYALFVKISSYIDSFILQTVRQYRD